MSREFSQQSSIAQDLFGRDTGGFGSPCSTSSAMAQSAPAMEQSKSCESTMNVAAKTPRASFSEDLWQGAVRRHCDSRQSWRQLLDRFVKPHP